MESKLTELVERLKTVAGSNLKALVLYGSAVTGEFLAKHSDWIKNRKINILFRGVAGVDERER